ncbi:MAG: hypothetical protein WAV54_13925 [Acidimicrobiales bacterium]
MFHRTGARILAGVLTIAIAGVGLPGTASSTVGTRTLATWTPIKGIALDVSDASKFTDAQTIAKAKEVFAWVVSLHANAVSLNFPFYESGRTSITPEASSITPSPGRLAAITAVAHDYNLSVEWRPYLSEKNFRDFARTSIQPWNTRLWFTNYWVFLKPYLEAAKMAGANSFSIAMETTSLLGYLDYWAPLVRQAKQVFGTQVFYSSSHVPYGTVPLTHFGYDAYQSIKEKSDAEATVGNFTVGFEKNFKVARFSTTPQDTTIEELGIPAVSGAYDVPNQYWFPPGTRIVRFVQANWFAGACNAFKHYRMAGIYFWSVNLEWFTPTENGSANPGAWVGTSTQSVVSKCFATMP